MEMLLAYPFVTGVGPAILLAVACRVVRAAVRDCGEPSDLRAQQAVAQLAAEGARR